MDIAPLLLVTLLTLFCAAYAHIRLPLYCATARQLWLARSALVLIGIGFGWAMLRFYGQIEPSSPTLIFLSAFGLVHVPAAAILFLKRVRDRPHR